MNYDDGVIIFWWVFGSKQNTPDDDFWEVGEIHVFWRVFLSIFIFRQNLCWTKKNANEKHLCIT